MSANPRPLDFTKLKVRPLAERESLSTLQSILVNPAQTPPPVTVQASETINECARKLALARRRKAAIILLYGAHLVKNGAMSIVNRMISNGWITHLATNGAGAIHDWELAFFGRTAESVRKNIATGSFGAWDETGRNIHLALLAGALRGKGFGASVGQFICEDGTDLPDTKSLERRLRENPTDAFAPALADLLQTMLIHHVASGRVAVPHSWKATSILAHSFGHNVTMTVHPGIGYDIISTHPMFNGAALGRAAQVDFGLLGAAIEGLDGGVILSVGSAIMAPQVVEKSLSCVNNLRLQAGRAPVQDHSIFVVDLQDGGNWDWSRGEPPKDNPAYYLRFCKSFARMGGAMNYAQCDNVAFLHNLLHRLEFDQ